jgi:hypothetical protein
MPVTAASAVIPPPTTRYRTARACLSACIKSGRL